MAKMARKDLSSLDMIRSTARCFEGILGPEMDFLAD